MSTVLSTHIQSIIQNQTRHYSATTNQLQKNHYCQPEISYINQK